MSSSQPTTREGRCVPGDDPSAPDERATANPQPPAGVPLVLIAAVARNGIVGRDGGMPWHLPEDLRYFREATAGCPVVMGRRTWDSLPPRFRPLPGRRNLVVSRQPGFRAEGAEVFDGLEAALAAARATQPPVARVFVIGGASLWAAALPAAAELWLTELELQIDGDTHFPAWDPAQFERYWQQPGQRPPDAQFPEGLRWRFSRWRRRAPAAPGG